MSVSEKSNNPAIPAVKGEDTGEGGFGVSGVSKSGHGVHGESKTSRGVVGTSTDFHGVFGKSIKNVGVAGESDSMAGVLGVCTNDLGEGVGVRGEHRGKGGFGVHGVSDSGHGVHGDSIGSRGVVGTSQTFLGVYGTSVSGVGVAGDSDSGKGVNGQSKTGDGVFGTGRRGVVGVSNTGDGVIGTSEAGTGVRAISKNAQGVTAFSDNDVGLFAQGGTFGAVFQGAVVVGKGPGPKDPNIKRNQVDGSIVINDGGSLFLNGGGDIILANADCAEDFDLLAAADADPGCVMVLDGNGTLRQCTIAYDHHVVGVLSGAGDYRPGVVLDRHPELKGRAPIALMGKVYCKVDADFGAIAVGDLLTTSATPGHAMAALDSAKAFGAVIGKALQPLHEGRGLIPILVALQ
jgi:hypothetical protein